MTASNHCCTSPPSACTAEGCCGSLHTGQFLSLVGPRAVEPIVLYYKTLYRQPDDCTGTSHIEDDVGFANVGEYMKIS